MARKDGDSYIQMALNICKTIELLSSDKGISITSLSEAIGTSRWTTKRILEFLSREYGAHQVESQSKREHRWRIDSKKVLPLSIQNKMLSDGELQLFNYLLKLADDTPIYGQYAEGLRTKFPIDEETEEYFMIKNYWGKYEDGIFDVVDTFLKAIKDNKWLSIEYFNYVTDENRHYEVKPLKVFVYNGEVYMRVASYNHCFTLAAERVVGVPEIIDAKTSIAVDSGEYFDCFGLYDKDEPVVAYISICSWQGRYLESRFKRESNVKVEFNDSSCEITIITKSEYGLYKFLYEQLDYITNIGPKSLYEDFMEVISKANDIGLINKQ